MSASNKNNQLNHGVIIENSESEENSNCPEDEDMDVPEIVEEVIEVLLSGLKDTVCLKSKILSCELFFISCVNNLADVVVISGLLFTFFTL